MFANDSNNCLLNTQISPSQLIPSHVELWATSTTKWALLCPKTVRKIALATAKLAFEESIWVFISQHTCSGVVPRLFVHRVFFRLLVALALHLRAETELTSAEILVEGVAQQLLIVSLTWRLWLVGKVLCQACEKHIVFLIAARLLNQVKIILVRLQCAELLTMRWWANIWVAAPIRWWQLGCCKQAVAVAQQSFFNPIVTKSLILMDLLLMSFVDSCSLANVCKPWVLKLLGRSWWLWASPMILTLTVTFLAALRSISASRIPGRLMWVMHYIVLIFGALLSPHSWWEARTASTLQVILLLLFGGWDDAALGKIRSSH